MKDALEIAGKLGTGGGIGFLLGWLMVWWVEPTTTGGTGLLIIISVVFCATIAGIMSKLLGTNKALNKENLENSTKTKTGRPQRVEPHFDYPPR